MQSFGEGEDRTSRGGKSHSDLALPPTPERMGMHGKGPSQEWEVASASLWEGIAPRGMEDSDERWGFHPFFTMISEP